jgi:hypothetical protein
VMQVCYCDAHIQPVWSKFVCFKSSGVRNHVQDPISFIVNLE